MALKLAIAAIVSSSWLQCQSETAVMRSSLSSLSISVPLETTLTSPPPSPTPLSTSLPPPAPPAPPLSDPSISNRGSGEGGPLLLILCVSILSVVGGCVLVTLVIVWAVRLRRAYKKWYTPSQNQPEITREREVPVVSQGDKSNVQLLSVALSNSSFGWTRPLSHSPASSRPVSSLSQSPPSPPPSIPSTHDYSEIQSISRDSPLVHPAPPSSRPHCYEEIDEEDVLNTNSHTNGSQWTNKLVHSYSILEGPTHLSPSHSNKLSYCDESQLEKLNSTPDIHNSIQDCSSLSQDSSLSIQDNNLNWILSPAARLELQHPRPPRRVVPYRVSLIIPQIEHPRPGQYPISTSCMALSDSGRYNHLKGVTGYGSLEEERVYATLEPFTGSSDEPMRPRSRSCDARLYNHLRH